jgi:DNA invertase Pin-like site-specific DNA recombinase
MKELRKYAIILVRVSTTIQDFEPQIKDLENYAKSKGYNVFHRIETKETGLADLKDKQGFEELKSFIKVNPQYNTIFATEMSRLGRRQSILHQIKEWLISNKIQLYLKDTTYSLYDDNGLISAAGEVMFTLFGYFAESEMKTKKERFKRAKTLLNSQGFSISGKRLFGYDREKDLEVKKNRYVINKVESEEIRNIFNWYAYSLQDNNEETSISSIVLECKKLNYSKYTHSKRNMNKLLKEEGYTGRKITKNKRKNPNYIEGENEDKYVTTSSILVYPQIISDELFLKVQEKMKLKNTNVDKSTKHLTILAKILICKGCGRYFTGQYRFDIDGGSRSAYRCSYTRGVRSCNNEKSISMRLIDSTIWSFIKSDISTLWNFIINNNQNKKDYDSQIKNLENLIQENLNILTRLNKRYQSMVYLNEEQEYQSQLEYIKTANKIRSETSQYENAINKINEEKIRSEKTLNDKYFEKILTDISDIEGSKNRIREIINLFIDELILIHQDKRYSVIKVKLKDNITSNGDNYSTLNYYTTIVIDKRETNKIKLVKALNLVEYRDNQLYVNDVELEIGEAFKLKSTTKDKLVQQIKNKNPYDFLFKEVEYIKLSFYKKGDSLLI